MNKKILLFGFQKGTGMAQAVELRRQIRSMNIEVELIDPKDYLKPIGTLAGLKIPVAGPTGMPSFSPGNYKGPELPLRILVMSGISDPEMDQLLKIYPVCGIMQNDLKAVLTPVNAAWNAIGLCNELRKEHERLIR